MLIQRTSRGLPMFVAGIVCTAAAFVLYAGLWAPSPAFGQIPDSGAQRSEMIKEQRVTNERLAEIAGLLREIRDQNKNASGKAKSAQP